MGNRKTCFCQFNNFMKFLYDLIRSVFVVFLIKGKNKEEKLNHND